MSVIAFRSRQGQRMFAFGSDTDPENVMVELAWAWTPPRQSICGLPSCPTTEDRYCCECHACAHAAAGAVRARREGGQTAIRPSHRSAVKNRKRAS